MALKNPFRDSTDVIFVTLFFIVVTLVILAAIVIRYAEIGF